MNTSINPSSQSAPALASPAQAPAPASPALTLLSSSRSGMGSGTLMVHTLRDDEGNTYTAIGGGAPTLTETAADRATRMRAVHEAMAAHWAANPDHPNNPANQ